MPTSRWARISPTAFQLARIRTLLEFFPIGKKLRYYPEFKQDIVFDTLILAYCVNGNYVYSSDAIDRDAEGNPTVFSWAVSAFSRAITNSPTGPHPWTANTPPSSAPDSATACTATDKGSASAATAVST